MECPVKPESGCTCTTVKEAAKMGPWSQAACSHVILALKTGNSQWCLYNPQSESDWLFNTQSRVLEVYWLVLGNSEKANIHVQTCPIFSTFLRLMMISLAFSRWQVLSELIYQKQAVIYTDCNMTVSRWPHSFNVDIKGNHILLW